MHFANPVDTAGVFRQWCQDKLVVPSGPRQHKPFILDDWQHDWVIAAFSADQAALTCGRKNGKTTLLAAICCFFLCGPGNTPNFSGITSSLTGKNASKLRDQVNNFRVMNPEIEDQVRVLKGPYPGSAQGIRNSEISFLACSESSGHSEDVDMSIMDEVGLFPEKMRGHYQAMIQSTAAREGKVFMISVLGEGTMFREFWDLCEETGQQAFRFIRHCADLKDPVDDISTWRKGNPGLGTVKSMKVMNNAYVAAKKNPKDMRIFKSLHLNMPISAHATPICSSEEWLACETENPPERSGMCYLGLDIGDKDSMTCAVPYWPETGLMEVYGAFADTMSLKDRSERDDVDDAYFAMRETGELQIFDARITPAEPFLKFVLDQLKDELFAGVYADKHRIDTTRNMMDSLGVFLDVVMINGQGWDAGTECVIGFQQAMAQGRIKTRKPSFMMRTAIAKSKIRFSEDAKSCKIDKRNVGSRIDALSAAIMSVTKGSQEVEMRKDDGWDSGVNLRFY